MIKNYEVLEESYNGSQLIKLTSGDYSGIIYSYGSVGFDEQGEQVSLRFDYKVHSDHDYDEQEFGKYIGDILVDLITEQLAKNEIVYTGGVDENRTTDSEQSDS